MGEGVVVVAEGLLDDSSHLAPVLTREGFPGLAPQSKCSFFTFKGEWSGLVDLRQICRLRPPGPLQDNLSCVIADGNYRSVKAWPWRADVHLEDPPGKAEDPSTFGTNVSLLVFAELDQECTEGPAEVFGKCVMM